MNPLCRIPLHQFLLAKKRHWFAILASFILLITLTACDPCDPLGVREVGVLTGGDPSKPALVAQVPYYGICRERLYISEDHGVTWKLIEYQYTKDAPNFSRTGIPLKDCVDGCEFTDSMNAEIRYRIQPGKTLQQSVDGGATWREILNVPAWSQIEKNYVRYTYWDTPQVPIDMRGPFSAVTDPQTGKILVSMGIEGILVGSGEGSWDWVEIAGFRQVQTSGRAMLAFINLQDWFRVPLIALLGMLYGVSLKSPNRRPLFTIITGILGLFFVLVPLEFTRDWFFNLFQRIFSRRITAINLSWFMPSALVMAFLLVIIILRIRGNAAPTRNGLLRTAGLAMASGLVYCLPFIVWSQGWWPFLSTYGKAGVFGFLLSVVFLVLIAMESHPNRGARPAKAVRTSSPSDEPHAPIP